MDIDMPTESFARRVRGGLNARRHLWTERRRSRSAQVHPNPVLIFGNQKSGTSAVAGLLSAATGVPATSDFVGAREPFIGRVIRGDVPVSRFIRQNAWAFSRPIIKEPGLTFIAEPVMDYLGVPRAVFIVRNPWSNIRSVLNRLGLAGHVERLALWERLRFNRTWQQILRSGPTGHGELGVVEALAQRWNCAADVYQSTQHRYYLVRYEDFCADKGMMIRSIAEAFGLRVTNDISALEDYAFQPRGKPNVNLPRFFGPRNMARIEQICGERARAFGYQAPQ
jgi:hypothetical protein